MATSGPFRISMSKIFQGTFCFIAAIRHGFSDITHIKVNNGRKSAILNLFKRKFFRAYPPPRNFTFCSIVMI